MNMKKIMILLALFGMPCAEPALACTVCRSRQPAPLRDITHGSGPAGILDYVITGGAVIVVVAVLILSAWYLMRPGERNPDHIKNIVLKGES